MSYMTGTDCRQLLLCTQSLYPADVIYQRWNNCEHKDISHFEFYFIHWRKTGTFKVVTATLLKK